METIYAILNLFEGNPSVAGEFGSQGPVKRRFGTSLLLTQTNGWPDSRVTHCDAIWRHRSGSILVQVMACCLTAPSHYMNKFRLIVSRVLCHSPESYSNINAHESNHYNAFENYTFEIKVASNRCNEVECLINKPLFKIKTKSALCLLLSTLGSRLGD